MRLKKEWKENKIYITISCSEYLLRIKSGKMCKVKYHGKQDWWFLNIKDKWKLNHKMHTILKGYYNFIAKWNGKS